MVNKRSDHDQPQPLSLDTVAKTQLLPLAELHLSAEVNGQHGTNRLPKTNFRLTAADDDVAAMEHWLNQRCNNQPQTTRIYRKEAERLILWAVFERHQAVSSLNAEDLNHYLTFLDDPKTSHFYDEAKTNPRYHWTPASNRTSDPARQYARYQAQWTPFKGPLSPRSKAHAVTIIRSMFEFWCRISYVGLNPLGVHKLAVTRQSIDAKNRSLSQAHWDFVVHFFDSWESRLPEKWQGNTQRQRQQRANYLLRGERGRCLLYVLYLTGVRISEMANFKMGDLKWQDGVELSSYFAEVLGKGEKLRRVPINQACFDAIIRYRQQVNALSKLDIKIGTVPRADDMTPIIFSIRGGRVKALTANGLHKEMKKLFAMMKELLDDLQQADPNSRWRTLDPIAFEKASTHWMRHTSATHQVRSGISLQNLQRNLGHASIDTSMIYNAIDDEERAQQAEGFSVASRPGLKPPQERAPSHSDRHHQTNPSKIFCLWLRVEKNGGAVETKPEWVRRDLEKELFPHYQIKKRSKEGWRYDVRFEQSDHGSYETQAEDLIRAMIEFVDPYWCFIECSILDESTEEPIEIGSC